MTKTVLILPGCTDTDAVKMFERRGWSARIIDSIEEINNETDLDLLDAVCFMGGTDVDPAIYGEERGPTTQSPDKKRDEFEVSVFNMFKDTDVYLFGICRGAQLLNVLNGGQMVQECGYRGGKQIDSKGRSVEVCHHQGILAQEDFILSESHDGMTYSMYYPETRSYGHQAHPEWCPDTEEVFFSEIEAILSST